MAGPIAPTQLKKGKGCQVSDFEFLRHVTIGQYLPTDSVIHRLDPRAKLWMVMLLVVGTVASTSLLGLVYALLSVLGALLIARVPLRFALKGLRPALPFLAIIALIQIFVVPPAAPGQVLFHWWRLTVTTASIGAAFVTLIRFGVLILAISLFSLSTRTTELTHGIEHLLRPLQKIRLPAHEFALTVVIALRFVPLLALEAERIVKAQASRGADFGHGRMGVLKRARRMLPLLVPLFVTALRRAETLALAMEARSYMGGRGRTNLIQLRARPNDGLAVACALLVAAAPVIATRMNVDQLCWTWLSGL
jgi:energy-coupling factor transport system permease protein